MKILVIDDDDGMAALLAKALRRLGHEVETTPSAGGAVVKVREGRFDAAVLDAGLQGMTALELAAVLRGLAPGLAMAFLASPDEIDRVRSVGAVVARVWTVTQLRELIVRFERYQERIRIAADPAREPRRREVRGTPSTVAEADPDLVSQVSPPPAGSLRFAPPGVAPPRRAPSGSPADARLPARKVRVQCRTWEQVARLCAQHASGKTVLTLRGAYRFREGEALVVALALPDELVLALRAEVTHVHGGGRGAVYGITLHGLTDTVRQRLELMVAAESTRPMSTPPGPYRPPSEISPS
jgi:CheY-like chemotaxis protein